MTFKPLYSNSFSITITLNGLASSATAGREGTSVSNATDRYEDVHVTPKVTLATGTPSNDKAVYVYAWGSEDGTTLPDNVSGADAAITLRVPTILRLAAIITCPDAGGVTYEGQPFSL